MNHDREEPRPPDPYAVGGLVAQLAVTATVLLVPAGSPVHLCVLWPLVGAGWLAGLGMALYALLRPPRGVAVAALLVSAISLFLVVRWFGEIYAVAAAS